VTDENLLVRYEIINGKYMLFGNMNEMIIETYGTRQLFILEGEVVRHTYTHSLIWNNLSSSNEAASIRDMRWWWKEITTQLKVQMEEGDSRLKYKEIYLTKVLWKAEFEKFERKWKFVFLPKRVIVKTFLVFKVGPKEIEISGTRRKDAHLWEFELYFIKKYVRMIVQFYEMFDAKCWYYPETIDLRDRRCIVMADESTPPILETRKDRRIRKYRKECLGWQKDHDSIMTSILMDNHHKMEYANTERRLGCCLVCGNKWEYCYCSMHRSEEDRDALAFEMQL
jgi:hypothetical protein